MSFPGAELSRWRALPGANVTGLTVGDLAEGWRVVAEDGREDYGPASPRVHSEHRTAQVRADELNRHEQYAALGVSAD